ncbi:hypothetical protein BaRGS_00026359 [Batillaria attramentaria]|uniref:Uncharacterized protein n=1 Tax=Batillaria attramentaria TaxID=370345 RepID=A0ABD0K4Q3_9CAEN
MPPVGSEMFHLLKLAEVLDAGRSTSVVHLRLLTVRRDCCLRRLHNSAFSRIRFNLGLWYSAETSARLCPTTNRGTVAAGCRFSLRFFLRESVEHWKEVGA